MTPKVNRSVRRFASIAFGLVLLALAGAPAGAGDYAALDGVKGLNTVFDFTLGSPATATVVFPAIKEVYTDKNVTALPTPPRTVIVFHGPAVKLISTDRVVRQEDHPTLGWSPMIRQFKRRRQNGGRMYAGRVRVDPATSCPKSSGRERVHFRGRVSGPGILVRWFREKRFLQAGDRWSPTVLLIKKRPDGRL
jgi:hypothetical protein